VEQLQDKVTNLQAEQQQLATGLSKEIRQEEQARPGEAARSIYAEHEEHTRDHAWWKA
jgi:hypothetical protein